MTASGKHDRVQAKASLLRRLAWAWVVLACCLPAAAAERVVPPGELFPVIIRIGEEAFNDDQSTVEERSPVEMCVLGAQNRGYALARGQVSVDLLPAPKHASLQLTFRGESTSHTTARHDPATIYSTTVSRFDCRTAIAFDEEQGFTAGASNVEVEIASMRRRIAVSSPGLRGRVVRNVARRRIAEKEGQIRQIALDTTKRRLSQSMNHRVEARISAWNNHWNQLRLALREQRWYVDLPRPFFASSDRELLMMLALEPAAAEQAAGVGIEAGLLPPRDPRVVADILVLEDWLDAQSDAEGMLSLLAETPETLALVMASELMLRVERRKENGWRLFQFYPKGSDEPAPLAATR